MTYRIRISTYKRLPTCHSLLSPFITLRLLITTTLHLPVSADVTPAHNTIISVSDDGVMILRHDYVSLAISCIDDLPGLFLPVHQQSWPNIVLSVLLPTLYKFTYAWDSFVQKSLCVIAHVRNARNKSPTNISPRASRSRHQMIGLNMANTKFE